MMYRKFELSDFTSDILNDESAFEDGDSAATSGVETQALCGWLEVSIDYPYYEKLAHAYRSEKAHRLIAAAQRNLKAMIRRLRSLTTR